MRNYITVISDTHLGNKYCQSDKLLKLISNLETDILILNGDIIDLWIPLYRMKWNTTENTIIQKIARLSRKGTKVYYLIGNHDYHFMHAVGAKFGNIEICRELVIDDMLFFHGDKLDFIMSSSKLRILAFLGDIGYNILMRLNAVNRWYRRKVGQNKSTETLSQKVKRSVKKVMFINGFKTLAVNEAIKTNCNKVFCGHIHISDVSYIDGVYYYNSGDFMEDSSYLTVDFGGNVAIKRVD